MKESSTKLEAELATKYGASQRERIQRGLKQVSDFWRKEDGPRDVFEDFVRTNFASPDRRKGWARLSRRPPAPLALEPARRNQSELFRR